MAVVNKDSSDFGYKLSEKSFSPIITFMRFEMENWLKLKFLTLPWFT